MIRVGILGHGLIGWGGGLDFLRLVCGSLLATGEPIELHLLTPTRGPKLAARKALRSLYHQARALAGHPVHIAKLPDLSMVREFVRSSGFPIAAHEIDLGSQAILGIGKRLNLDVVLPSQQTLDLGGKLPWVGYIPDFQHLHLPHFFSAREITQRNRDFRRMLMRASTVIVNAQAVASDARSFAPGAAAHIVPLPFSAAPNPTWFMPHDAPLLRYGIDRPYFIICNQFWQHKDHLTAYRAFTAYLAKAPDSLLVCTGETGDYRNPRHFEMLAQEAEALGINGRLRILGLIPKIDQIALLRQSMALVQPTLFEGGPGGGAVYDAVSLGVPALVSDIPVNREINEAGVRFFRANDPQALAEEMIANGMAPRANLLPASALIERGRQRRVACGLALMQAIDLARSVAHP